MTSMMATKPATLSSVQRKEKASRLSGTASLAVIIAAAGSSTSASTMARSSTTSQPTAMRPRSVSRMCRSCKARIITTVLATESARPNTRPAAHDQPSTRARPAPISVASAIWPIAPGTAMRATDIRSLSEKCSPTPNISRMTPISASSAASSALAVKPGVNGPTTTPATR